MTLLYPLISRWVAGDSVESAIAAARKASLLGIKPLVNYVGEHYKIEYKVEKAVATYLRILGLLREEAIAGDISLKLTQIGLDIGKGYCLDNLLSIAEKAKKTRSTVWIDMESATYTKSTLEIYSGVAGSHSNIAVTIQANLKRSRSDVLDLLARKGRIRLVKGAYKGYYTDHDAVAFNFSNLMRMLFRKSDGFAIATTDEDMITEARLLESRYKKRIEFQFLRGVGKKLKRSLLREGFPVSDYIPFGEDSISYAWRRVKERKSIIMEMFR